MTNFEAIKNFSVEKMAEFLDVVENNTIISFDFCENKMCGLNCNECDDCSFNEGIDVQNKLWLMHETSDYFRKYIETGEF